MAPRVVLLVLCATTAAILAACGGSAPSRTASSSGGGAQLVSGKEVFSAHCSVCHSLDGRNHPRLQGGDLLGFHASRAEVEQFVREMPVVRRPLTSPQLRAVVDYVIAAERSAAGH
jgi:mono/diheme cytochrome c family protein